MVAYVARHAHCAATVYSDFFLYVKMWITYNFGSTCVDSDFHSQKDHNLLAMLSKIDRLLSFRVSDLKLQRRRITVAVSLILIMLTSNRSLGICVHAKDSIIEPQSKNMVHIYK